MQLASFYTVVTDFAEFGFGNAGDATQDRDAAYDQYAEVVEDGQPARAFFLEFDADTNALETCSEVTGDFNDELERIRNERDLMAAE